MSVLDAGEYVRLGETSTRRADLRLVGATNRPLDEIKHDLLGRFAHRVPLPGLEERREDIPLLLRHRLRAIAASEPDVARRFGTKLRDEVELRVAQPLVSALLRRPYTLHVREVEAILWRAIAASQGDAIDLAPEDAAFASTPRAGGITGAAEDAAAELSPERIQASLDANIGALEDTWRALGLSSRHALGRLIKRHGLQIRRRPT